MGGEKSAVLWAELAGKNKPCPIRVQEGVTLRRASANVHSVPVYSFYRFFNTF